MSQILSLELSDELYTSLKQQAEVFGLSVQELIVSSLMEQSSRNQSERSLTVAEKEAVRERFRHHAGSIDLGYATGIDNEGIDADLARAYDSKDDLGE